MAYVCPRCGAPSLRVVEAVELNTHRLERIRCTACGLTGAAEWRETRLYEGFVAETWDHDGCLLDAAGEDAVRLWFASSPRPEIDGLESLARPLSWFPMRGVC